MLKYPITVTLDTNILDAAKYDFSENSTLQLLGSYVKKGKIKVVLSDIVVREAKIHLTKQVKKVCGIARSLRADALKESTEYLINYIGLNRLLELISDKKELEEKSVELLEKFILDIDAEILYTDLIDLDAIIDDYFEIRPPFESGEKKRKEFPDAFIACQIRNRFKNDETVAIISADKGFKEACQNTSNHLFFDNLGLLYNMINEEETVAYENTVNIVKELQFRISSMLLTHIKDNENINVIGMSYDKDGIASGFDYDEFYLHCISNLSFKIHSVDKMTEKTSLVTLSCNADISVNCYYEDYDNAPWDSETKDYVHVDTITMREEHAARFACRIEIDREAKTFKIFPFSVTLGGDSRKERYEVEGQPVIDYEQEIQDMDRKTLGLTPLGSYESYLEEDLPNSTLSKDIMKQFEKINSLYNSFEDFCVTYDELIEKLNNPSSAKQIIKLLSESLKDISDFPDVIDKENIEDNEVEEIKRWVEEKYENASELAEIKHLPDVLKYGESIVIKGIDGSQVIFTIDEIAISPSEGSEEFIDIHLSDDKETIATGHIKLLVGYLNFDEDGGASDGIGDEVDYEYREILEKLKCYISDQEQIVENEAVIVKTIENAII